MVYIRSRAGQIALESPGRMSTICYTGRRMVIRAVNPEESGVPNWSIRTETLVLTRLEQAKLFETGSLSVLDFGGCRFPTIILASLYRSSQAWVHHGS